MGIEPQEPLRHVAFIFDSAHDTETTTAQVFVKYYRKLRKIIGYVADFGDITTVTFWLDSLFVERDFLTLNQELQTCTDAWLVKTAQMFNEKSIRVTFIGARLELSSSMQSTINMLENRTKENTGILLQLALNYRGREEVTSAAKHVACAILKNLGEYISEDKIASHLYTRGVIDPDLLVLTGGQKSSHDFMLWQAAYAEWCSVEKKILDFTEDDFVDCVAYYALRDRRKGGVR